MDRQTEVHNLLVEVADALRFIKTHGDTLDDIDEVVARQYRIQDIMTDIIEDLLTII